MPASRFRTPLPIEIKHQHSNKSAEHWQTKEERVESGGIRVLIPVWKVVTGPKHIEVGYKERVCCKQPAQNP